MCSPSTPTLSLTHTHSVWLRLQPPDACSNGRAHGWWSVGSSWSRAGGLQTSAKQAKWSRAMPTGLCAACSCFCTKRAELCSCDGDCEAKKIYYMVLYRASLPTPVQQDRTWTSSKREEKDKVGRKGERRREIMKGKEITQSFHKAFYFLRNAMPNI